MGIYDYTAYLFEVDLGVISKSCFIYIVWKKGKIFINKYICWVDVWIFGRRIYFIFISFVFDEGLSNHFTQGSFNETNSSY